MLFHRYIFTICLKKAHDRFLCFVVYAKSLTEIVSFKGANRLQMSAHKSWCIWSGGKQAWICCLVLSKNKTNFTDREKIPQIWSTFEGKNCFAKMLPKKIKIFMDTLLRLLQRDFYIMNIITSHKNKSWSAFFLLISSYYLECSLHRNVQLVQDKWIWVLEADKWKLRSQCRLISWSSGNT